jgi:multiple sugar transport system ATP-binding protein
MPLANLILLGKDRLPKLCYDRAMASVIFEHVTKGFDDVTIVSDLNLRIADKEFLVLVGPSGCGKTTILRMLAGLEKVDEGTIRIGDRIVNDLSPAERNIAMVFEKDALYPHLTVDDNISFSLKLRKTPAEEILQRVKETANSLGLPNLLNWKPSALSLGQRQQVAIGRAMVREPAVFLMDEPLANLDAQKRFSARAEIKELHRRLGTTFVYVTHDQVEAMALGDRIAILNEGRLQQVDPPRVLYNMPDNVFVAGFIGSPPMNMLLADLIEEAEGLVVDAGAFRFRLSPGKRLYAYEPYVGQQVIYGFRPEAIHVPIDAPDHQMVAPFQAQVEAVELLGAESLLHLKASAQSFIARVDSAVELHTGQAADLLLDFSTLRLFDSQSGRAIR